MTLWEVSFECGNKVGGIWTVITSKAPYIKEAFGDDYYAIGPYKKDRKEVLLEKMPRRFQYIATRLAREGIAVHYGSWVEAAGVKIFLLDTRRFRERVDSLKGKLWEKYGIDSLGTGHDFNEPLAWSYAAGMFISEAMKKLPGRHIVQLQEWLSAGALFYFDMHGVKARTVFTTHATVLGRATGGKISGNPEQLAREKGVIAKHLTEKSAARLADALTTVSDPMADECRRVLGRKPDFITYNGLDFQVIPELPRLLSDKVIFRKKLTDFVRAYFLPYYRLSVKDFPVVYTAGRYEFFNKGYDLFIDALGEVNRRLKAAGSDRWFLAFLLVPAGTLGVKDEVIQNFAFYRRLKEIAREDVDALVEEVYEGRDLEGRVEEMVMDFERMRAKMSTRRGSAPPLCAFQLSYPEKEDQIVQRLRENGLLNREEDRVKVVYYPVYLNRQDELMGMSYRNFLTAASMGVFLSRYEPWGYTPMEAASYLGTSITTSHSGFGRAVLGMGGPDGLGVVDVSRGIKEVADRIESFIMKPKDERISLEINAHKFVRDGFSWKHLITNYLNAYRSLD